MVSLHPKYHSAQFDKQIINILTKRHIFRDRKSNSIMIPNPKKSQYLEINIKGKKVQ